ncbi:hypothetical protein GCM10019017_25480 [Streptomyces showdoensis]
MFGFAVGLGQVGAGEFAGGAEVGEGVLPGQAFAVGPGVVGQDPFDAGDATGVEERGRAGEEGALVNDTHQPTMGRDHAHDQAHHPQAVRKDRPNRLQ